MSSDWFSNHSDKSENSETSKFPLRWILRYHFYVQGKNNKSEFFSDTWNCLEVTIRVLSCHFFPVPKNDNSEIYFCMGEPCLEAKIPSYHFVHYTETITQNFFKPTIAFNLENIVQVCLVFFSQTHRVSKDFSKSVKDYTFRVPSDHFLVWGNKR